ncbi:MAG: DNA polymerase III subunit delta [Elusimicrobiales bacterium]|nr:DNA polymerase III subunit delta [Elusimicrobiales bacterium]
MKVKSEKEFLKDIVNLKLDNAYILIGDDTERKKNHLKQLKTKIPSEFDYTTFSQSQSIELLISDLITPPLFASKRIVVVDNFEKLKANDKKNIFLYLQNPSNSTSLFLLHNENLKDYQIKKEYENISATIIVFQDITPDEIKEFFLDFFNKSNIKVDNKTMQYISNSIINFSQMKNEIEKLWLYTDNKNILTLKEAQQLITSFKEIEISEISENIIMKDIDKFKNTLNILISQKEEPIKILQAIEYTLEKILKIKLILKKYTNPPYELTQLLAIYKFDIEKAKRANIHSFSEEKLIKAIDLSVEAESILKSSAHQDFYGIVLNVSYFIIEQLMSS